MARQKRSGKSTTRATRKPATASRGRLTRKRSGTAAYRRALRERTDEGVRAEIDQTVEAGARLREEILARIERGLSVRDRRNTVGR